MNIIKRYKWYKWKKNFKRIMKDIFELLNEVQKVHEKSNSVEMVRGGFLIPNNDYKGEIVTVNEIKELNKGSLTIKIGDEEITEFFNRKLGKEE